jgi:hypothetical protein
MMSDLRHSLWPLLTLRSKTIFQCSGHRKAHNHGDHNMGGLELLGILAMIIGIKVLLKSRKKSDR